MLWQQPTFLIGLTLYCISCGTVLCPLPSALSSAVIIVVNCFEPFAIIAWWGEMGGYGVMFIPPPPTQPVAAG